MKAHGLVDDDGGFTAAGRESKQRIEALTDDLAVAPYECLEPAEVEELVRGPGARRRGAHRRSGLGVTLPGSSTQPSGSITGTRTDPGPARDGLAGKASIARRPPTFLQEFFMTKAAIATAVGAPLEIVDIDVADPKAGEVRIGWAPRASVTPTCRSRTGRCRRAADVLGHEGAGVIDQVGEGVDHLAVGDHVVVSWVPQCGECFFCTAGPGGPVRGRQPGVDDRRSARLTSRAVRGRPAVSADGVVGHVRRGGGHPRHRRGEDRLETSRSTSAALIGCGVLTGFGAAVNTASIRKGDTVAVIGCGGVGLNVIQGAKHAGAERIIAVDMVDDKLEHWRSSSVRPTSSTPATATRSPR